jgi:hypothetical protein
MIWKVLALLGAGSFFVVGFDIATDPNCDSVSFRGGGARSVLTTCFTGTTGDFSKSFAVIGSFLVGIAILTFIFWAEINAYIRNLELRERFESALEAAKASYNDKSDLPLEESSSKETESGFARNRFHNYWIILSQTFKSNKVVSLVLIVILLIGFYKTVAPKISLFNPITCASLKRDLAAKDVIGRQIWNSYQEEVSRLSQVDLNSNSYFLQVGNAARRALQLNINDDEGYQMLKSKPHCVKNISVLEDVSGGTDLVINHLNGTGTIDNKKFSVYDGWNVNYYQSYADFKVWLK